MQQELDCAKTFSTPSPKLTVVGLGPGSPDYMSEACRRALEAAELIVGYKTYIDLVVPLYPHKNYFQTGMRGEQERCREALRLASSGQRVALVCSGDAGVYGLASLIYELAPDYQEIDIAEDIQIIPGISAALSGAALLGSPLTNDFVVLSLSDLLTPWELICQRLEAAGQGDFCLAIYNPGSKSRVDHLRQAVDILLKYRSPHTVCGITRQIGRPEEASQLMCLADLRDYQADMFTTIFVGNSQTQAIQGKMVTPRGYTLD